MAKWGYTTENMFSFLKKEATYGAAVTMNGTNALFIRGSKCKVEWPDLVQSDADMVTGTEFPTQQEILQNKVKITITQERTHPNFLIAGAAMAFGSVTATKDGANDAYTHKCVPMAVNTAMPTINGEVKIAGVQYLYKGLAAESWKFGFSEDGYITSELVLVGSGSRDSSATSFVTVVSESWLKSRNIRAWKETLSDISINATPTQGSQSISSGAGHSLSSRLKSGEFSWSNNPDMLFDNLGIDHGKRTASLKISLDYDDGAELTEYLAQANTALEIDLNSGTKIDPDGNLCYGMKLIVPSCRIKAAPIPDGGETGKLGTEYDVLIMDDGTNDEVLFYGYNATAAFLA